MSSEARLCKEILLQEFGPYVSRVSHQLLLKGRLTLPDLIRFTGFTTREVKESLIVLIQHCMVFFSEAPEGKIESTYYSIDPIIVMFRLNLGSILRDASEQGKEAESICRLLFLNGRMTIKDVIEWAKENTKKGRKQSFTQLVISQYIKAVLPEHSRSTMDRLLDATEKEKEKYTIMTAKDIANAKISAEAQIDAVYGTNEVIGMKRKVVDLIDEQRKRAALMELGQEMVEEEAEIDENVYFTINYDKFNMMFRNNSIIDFATERINRSAGQVVKAFFDYGKDKIKSIKEADSRKYKKKFEKNSSASPVHIANLLSKSDMTTRGDIVLPKDPMDPNKKPSLQEVVRGYIMLLKMDPAGFVKSKDERGANQFSINFQKLRDTMKRQIVEGLVRERYGVSTCRIFKILTEKGKLEESQIQKLAMLPAKDTREKLALLMTKGFVEIQEVPRTADRAPGRCFYLWYVPFEKCYSEVLMESYRVVCNLQQRKQQELKIRERLVNKMNRKDVIENPDLLSESEKKEIEQMKKVIERLEVAKSRISNVIMILRDF